MGRAASKAKNAIVPKPAAGAAAEAINSKSADAPPADPSLTGAIAGDDVDDIVLSRMLEQANDILSALRSDVIDRHGKKAEPRFPISRVAQMVGRTDSLIREAEKTGRLPAPERGENNRRVNYTLTEVNNMRRVFGTVPRRGDDEKAVVLAVQNFKGGVGKSTLSIHLAQYLAIQGYRVCLVDCDSQASTTMQFGIVPDLDLTEDDTLYGYLRGDADSLESRLIATHFDGLFLVPANLELYQIEYELAALVARDKSQGFKAFRKIDQAVQSVAHLFDVIILDPPPALGMVSLSVMAAANAMVIPTPPTIVDFSSTASFIKMMIESMSFLATYRTKPVYSFVKLAASKVAENKGIHRQILTVMQQIFGRGMLNGALKDSAEIDNASARMMTVYELEKPVTSREVYTRCLTSLNSVCSEIEVEIRKTWPSHHAALTQEGIL